MNQTTTNQRPDLECREFTGYPNVEPTELEVGPGCLRIRPWLHRDTRDMRTRSDEPGLTGGRTD